MAVVLLLDGIEESIEESYKNSSIRYLGKKLQRIIVNEKISQSYSSEISLLKVSLLYSFGYTWLISIEMIKIMFSVNISLATFPFQFVNLIWFPLNWYKFETNMWSARL